MSFIQIIEFTTSRIDDVLALDKEWEAATEGSRTTVRALTCADRDNPNRYFAIVEFPSHEEAMRNSDLPATQELSQKYAALCDGPPRFINLDVLSDSAG